MFTDSYLPGVRIIRPSLAWMSGSHFIPVKSLLNDAISNDAQKHNFTIDTPEEGF
jgi:hypothetical protein